jgi:Cdc6-like AAA superfamily ATPase
MKSPFKFLDAYTKEDNDVFFGRENETDTLYNALSGVKHLLVYGPSGAGKTSLIECGLRNQFSDADWYALSIRKGKNINESVFTEINKALHNKLPQNGTRNFSKLVENLFTERYQPIYLLFDQFEELLILGKTQEKKKFFKSIKRLIHYKVPCRILFIMREEFIGHLSEYEQFCPTIFQNRYRVEKMNKR